MLKEKEQETSTLEILHWMFYVRYFSPLHRDAELQSTARTPLPSKVRAESMDALGIQGG